MTVVIRRCCLLLLVLTVVVAPLHARPALADRTSTLRRASENIVQGPLDMVLSPVVAGDTLVRNIDAADYNIGATSIVAFVGYPALLFVTAWAAGFRMWSGLLEFPVGLGLLVSKSFSDWEPAPFFETEREPALVDAPNDIFGFKFGVYYVANTNIPK